MTFLWKWNLMFKVRFKKSGGIKLLTMINSMIVDYFIFVIIGFCLRHRVLWFILTIHPCHSLILEGPLRCILYPHRADVSKFLLISRPICWSQLENVAYEFGLASLPVPPACIVHLTQLVYEMEGWWLYSCCFSCFFWYYENTGIWKK